MSKKFGLGKGLNALIPEEVSNNINSKKEKNKDGVALIDINLIKNNNESCSMMKRYWNWRSLLNITELYNLLY